MKSISNILIICLLCIACQKDVTQKDEYISILHRMASNDVEASYKAFNELNEFSSKYPESRFADDAAFFYLDYKSSPMNSDEAQVEWLSFCNKYSNHEIETDTLEVLDKLGWPLMEELFPYEINYLEAKLVTLMLDDKRQEVRQLMNKIISTLDPNNINHAEKINMYKRLLKIERWQLPTQ